MTPPPVILSANEVRAGTTPLREGIRGGAGTRAFGSISLRYQRNDGKDHP
jgi:hypothetical protein